MTRVGESVTLGLFCFADAQSAFLKVKLQQNESHRALCVEGHSLVGLEALLATFVGA